MSRGHTGGALLDTGQCRTIVPPAKLLKSRGYRLVGVHSLGFNAFFVRDGVGDDLLPERSPEECHRITPRLHFWNPGNTDLILAGPEPWEEV